MQQSLSTATFQRIQSNISESNHEDFRLAFDTHQLVEIESKSLNMDGVGNGGFAFEETSTHRIFSYTPHLFITYLIGKVKESRRTNGNATLQDEIMKMFASAQLNNEDDVKNIAKIIKSMFILILKKHFDSDVVDLLVDVGVDPTLNSIKLFVERAMLTNIKTPALKKAYIAELYSDVLEHKYNENTEAIIALIDWMEQVGHVKINKENGEITFKTSMHNAINDVAYILNSEQPLAVLKNDETTATGLKDEQPMSGLPVPFGTVLAGLNYHALKKNDKNADEKAAIISLGESLDHCIAMKQTSAIKNFGRSITTIFNPNTQWRESSVKMFDVWKEGRALGAAAKNQKATQNNNK